MSHLTKREQLADSRRFCALDGLRGFAAVIVLVHHVALTSPALARVYEPGATRVSGWAGLAAYTPLHLLWSGREAVYVFFVLSGLVLTLPLTRDRAVSWLAYYPKRLVRLYAPIWAALAVSVVLVVAVGRDAVDGASWWVNLHSQPLSAHLIFHDAAVVVGYSTINSAFWSLRWEVIFSLLLPVYAVIAIRFAPRRLLVAEIIALAAVCGLGAAVGRPEVELLPIFLLGALLAVHRDDLRRRIARLSPLLGVLTAVVTLVALDAPWYVPSANHGGSRGVFAALATVQFLGATLLVALFMYWRPFVTAGESRIGTTLGRLSFSLYLIHEPIVVSVAHLLGPNRSGWTALIAIPLSFVAAAAFYRWIEGPSHRLSQAIGRAVAGRQELSLRRTS